MSTFLVKDEGLWDALQPDIQDGAIALSKTEFSNLYRARSQS